MYCKECFFFSFFAFFLIMTKDLKNNHNKIYGTDLIENTHKNKQKKEPFNIGSYVHICKESKNE